MNKTNYFFLGFSVGSAIMFLIVLSLATPTSVWREQAIKAHAGEYYLDEKHEVQWRWLNCR